MKFIKFFRININKALNYISYILKLEKSLGKPYIKVLEPTNACMMNCVMCPRKNMTRKVKYMDLELYKKIIDQAEWNNHLDFSHFGDPLMHPKIDKMIEYANSKGIKVQIYANPNMLTEEMCSKLIQSKLQLLYITIDGTDDKTYKYFRGKNADYEKAIEKINTLLRIKKEKDSNIKIILSMILMKENKYQVDTFKKIWEDKEGIDKIEIKDCGTFDGSDSEIFKHVTKEQKKDSECCGDAWTGIVVTANGNAVPCCYDYDEKFVLGDLKTESLKKVWNGEKIKFLRQNFKNHTEENISLCKNCKNKHKINIFNIFLSKLRNLKVGIS